MLYKLKTTYFSIIKRDTPFWLGSFYGLLLMASIAFVGISLGMPTGRGWWFDIPVITLTVMILIVFGCMLGAGILTLIRLPLPRLFLSGVICIYCTLSFTLTQFNLDYLGAAFITAVMMLIGILVGSSLALVFQRKRKTAWSTALTYFYACFSTLLLIYGLVWLISPGHKYYDTIRPEDSAYMPMVPPSVTDPSQPGEFDYHMFTYGSGEDLHRIDFSDQVDFVTATVDASAFLTQWHPLRSQYWGFDESEIPIEGHVWMPEGEGPFPLVLIVHGSSKMENFSDEGYDYLGELFASRGFITASVAQNFINYSVWSDGIDWDMTTRAWLLLQHLNTIEQASITEDTPFYNKIDWENIALIGHSRGGQAAALAASFAEFYNDDHHPEISVEVNYSIKAVAAIAPTDRLIENRYVRLREVDYFVIQGSQDSDVNTFYGNRQYQRTYWSRGSQGFKASLYVEGASHGEFNTVWGDKDTTMPTALLLNKREQLAGEEQRQIAKVMITAFLEASLHGERQYLSLLRDSRAAQQWLPETTYVNRFEDDTFVKVSNYEKDDDLHTTGLHGGRFDGHNLKAWEEIEVDNRTGHSTLNHAVKLAWDGRKTGSYVLTLPDQFAQKQALSARSSLGFSLANADISRLTPYKEVPRITIKFVANDGIEVALPLHQFRSYPPIIHSRFTKLGIFENTVKFGNLGRSAEYVFQDYEVPFTEAMAKEPRFKPSELREVYFIFEKGKPGKVLLDDIGFSIYNEQY